MYIGNFNFSVTLVKFIPICQAQKFKSKEIIPYYLLVSSGNNILSQLLCSMKPLPYNKWRLPNIDYSWVVLDETDSIMCIDSFLSTISSPTALNTDEFHTTDNLPHLC